MRKLNNLIPDEGITAINLIINISESFLIEINKATQVLSYAIYHGAVYVPTFTAEIIDKNTINLKRNYHNQERVIPDQKEELGYEFEKNYENINESDQMYTEKLVYPYV